MSEQKHLNGLSLLSNFRSLTCWKKGCKKSRVNGHRKLLGSIYRDDSVCAASRDAAPKDSKLPIYAEILSEFIRRTSTVSDVSACAVSMVNLIHCRNVAPSP